MLTLTVNILPFTVSLVCCHPGWVWQQADSKVTEQGMTDILLCSVHLGPSFCPHSHIRAWRIPYTVQSIGSQRVRHDWATYTSAPAWVQEFEGFWCIRTLGVGGFSTALMKIKRSYLAISLSLTITWSFIPHTQGIMKLLKLKVSLKAERLLNLQRT